MSIKMSTTSASCIFSMVIRSLTQMRVCALLKKTEPYGYDKVMRTTTSVLCTGVKLQTPEVRKLY